MAENGILCSVCVTTVCKMPGSVIRCVSEHRRDECIRNHIDFGMNLHGKIWPDENQVQEKSKNKQIRTKLLEKPG